MSFESGVVQMRRTDMKLRYSVLTVAIASALASQVWADEADRKSVV